MSRPLACRRRGGHVLRQAPLGRPCLASRPPFRRRRSRLRRTRRRSRSSGRPGPVFKLSLDDTVTRALGFNLDVQVQRVDPRLQDCAVQGAQAVWNPNLTNDTRFNELHGRADGRSARRHDHATRTFTTTSGIAAGAALVRHRVQRRLDERSPDVGRCERQQFNPSLSSTMTFNVTQPLLRDFLTDSNRTNLLVTRKQREITDVALQQTIVQTTRQVRNASGIWSTRART